MVEFDRISDFFDQIWQIFDQIQPFSIKFEVRFKFGPRFRIVAMISMDFSNKFGSKKSIKSQFEYDLDWILAGGRSNRISLVDSEFVVN